jgi:hypothetical protein
MRSPSIKRKCSDQQKELARKRNALLKVTVGSAAGPAGYSGGAQLPLSADDSVLQLGYPAAEHCQ